MSEAGVPCDCGAILPLKVCRSAAGYYIGRWCDECGPYERLSEHYFRTQLLAEAALASGQWTRRPNP